jgi:hypothetical protein
MTLPSPTAVNKLRLRELWKDGMAARGLMPDTTLRASLTEKARKSGLVASLGGRGEGDVAHVIDWALRGKNPWADWEFPPNGR